MCKWECIFICSEKKKNYFEAATGKYSWRHQIVKIVRIFLYKFYLRFEKVCVIRANLEQTMQKVKRTHARVTGYSHRHSLQMTIRCKCECVINEIWLAKEFLGISQPPDGNFPFFFFSFLFGWKLMS